MSKTIIIEGEYSLNTDGVYAKYAAHAPSGAFPRRFVDILTVDDEEDVAAYLNGQEAFAAGAETPVTEPEPMHLCKRCKRPCKVRFAHCYRCSQYLKVKASIAKRIA